VLIAVPLLPDVSTATPISAGTPRHLVLAVFAKLQWGVVGRGKRDGIRVIYFLRLRQGEIWMLTLYAKNVAENIPANVLKKIREEIDAEG
jgi:hypothetical protein